MVDDVDEPLDVDVPVDDPLDEAAEFALVAWLDACVSTASALGDALAVASGFEAIATVSTGDAGWLDPSTCVAAGVAAVTETACFTGSFDGAVLGSDC